MKNLLMTCLCVVCMMSAPNVSAKVNDILPKPQNVTLDSGGGAFLLGRAVALTDGTGCRVLMNFLDETGCTVSADASAKIRVETVSAIDGAYDYELFAFENEAYSLDVSPDEIVIRTVTPTGVIRAAQTLVQLAEGYDGETPRIEALSITDWPAFKLRGWMQDVGRSFLSISELKREIDLLSRFKVNVFHWHLTEKLAWRFEVKAYPALTEAENMIRYKGQYYTQAQCSELEAYAAERGVTVIPEVDMPGHSDVFTSTMGFDMQSVKGRAALKVILREVAGTFTKAPYIHIGGDEVTIQDGFLEEMSGFVRDSLGRKVVLWNKLNNKAVTSDIADMTQMWATSGTAVKGLPNIDCRYNYTNHFDVYADLVGIYKSSIYYAQRGSADIAGTVSAAWNDTKVATEDDIIRQNNQYANILASAERAWCGGGKRYIEAGGTKLPNRGDEFDEFQDFDRRFLFHKAHSLKDVPIPYVRQTNVHWRITEPFPNGGDATKAFPPELSTDTLLPESFVYEGKTYSTSFATGAGIYLRHIWHPTVPSYFASPANNQTAYAWTYVHSPEDRDVAAQIEFYTYSRSGNEYAPPAGKWDRRGSRIWLNGEEIPAPEWEQPDQSIPQDNATRGLTNENLTARDPVALHLNKGWNKVLMKLPHASNGGTGRDKWQFTFVITDKDGRNAADGLIYSPDKSITDEIPESAFAFPKLSNETETYWYEFCTPARESRYVTSKGAGAGIMGETTPSEASQWKFMDRGDGTFDIINRADNSYISPAAANNSQLGTTTVRPSTGWVFSEASGDNRFIISNGTCQIHQTNAGYSYKVFNWGGASNVTDAGCQYYFTLVSDNEPVEPEQKTPKLSTAEEDHWYRMSTSRFSSRYPTASGVGQPIVSNVGADDYLAQWKFDDRGDGTFNIVNRGNGLYVSPVAQNNAAIVTTMSVPEAGWQFMPSAVDGYLIIVSGTTEINQTKEYEGFKLYNWGYDPQTAGQYRTDDTGCQFSFVFVETEDALTSVDSAISTGRVSVVNGRISAQEPFRLYSVEGRQIPPDSNLSRGLYLVRTANGVHKVTVK